MRYYYDDHEPEASYADYVREAYAETLRDLELEDAMAEAEAEELAQRDAHVFAFRREMEALSAAYAPALPPELELPF